MVVLYYHSTVYGRYRYLQLWSFAATSCILPDRIVACTGYSVLSFSCLQLQPSDNHVLTDTGVALTHQGLIILVNFQQII